MAISGPACSSGGVGVLLLINTGMLMVLAAVREVIPHPPQMPPADLPPGGRGAYTNLGSFDVGTGESSLMCVVPGCRPQHMHTKVDQFSPGPTLHRMRLLLISALSGHCMPLSLPWR